MSTFTVESFGNNTDVVVLERSSEVLPHLVFKGTKTGLMHRIYTEHVATDERLQDTLKQLGQKPWMTDELLAQLTAEISWLRSPL
jgi:hypothetical protein